MLVCHLTSVHPRYDVRIFTKECVSLAKAGYSVRLLVSDGRGAETRDGVAIEDAGYLGRSRFRRILSASGRFFEKCREVDADLYHLHDPELIPCGLKLRKMGKKVVYDIHEDVPRQLLSKSYLIPPVSRVAALAFEGYENMAVRRFDALVAATPHIRGRFQRFHPLAVEVNNFPVLPQTSNDGSLPWSSRKRQVCYVGSLSLIRGLDEMVEAACLLTEGKILLAGRFTSQSLLERFAEVRPTNAEYLGYADQGQVARIVKESVAGLVLYHPVPNHINAQPNKLFEYMAAGIPVIASDFPLWRALLREASCGLLVDPLDPKAIARAIEWILANPAEAEAMGNNGRKAVELKYNWLSEERKLLGLYRRLERP